jgi:hypothetical protein
VFAWVAADRTDASNEGFSLNNAYPKKEYRVDVDGNTTIAAASLGRGAQLNMKLLGVTMAPAPAAGGGTLLFFPSSCSPFTCVFVLIVIQMYNNS